MMRILLAEYDVIKSCIWILGQSLVIKV